MIFKSKVKTIRYTSDLVICQNNLGDFTIRSQYPIERWRGFKLPIIISVVIFIFSGLIFDKLLLFISILFIWICLISLWIFHQKGEKLVEASKKSITIDGVTYCGISTFWERVIFYPSKEKYLAIYGVNLSSGEEVCVFQTDARQLFGEFCLWKDLARKIDSSYVSIK
jgi:hypothetical protein